jgi:hypothetical protein
MSDALHDADVQLQLQLGGYREDSEARAWKGQVLVDWEADEEAGGCLLRPEVVGRLLNLGAQGRVTKQGVRLTANPRVVAALSPKHAALTTQLGQAPAMLLTLRFGEGGLYEGGEEAYVVEKKPGVTLLKLSATLKPRQRA